MLQGQKILVVGASGFIGSALARALAKENRVYGAARFTREGARQRLEACGVIPVPMDITRDSLDGLPDDFDYVFNEVLSFGGAGGEREILETNAFSVARLLECYRRCKGAVLGSTGSVYRMLQEPVNEEAPLGGDSGPITSYVLSKICADAFAAYFSQEYGIPVAILRYYQPYSEDAGVVRSTVRRIAEGQAMARDPSLISPLFLTDVVDFTIKAAGACASPPTVINVGGEEAITGEALASMAGKALGIEPQLGPPPGRLSGSWACDSKKRVALLGQQEVSLAEGISRVIATYRRQRPSAGSAPETAL